jgi:uncharacterized delta-60 repeat protein
MALLVCMATLPRAEAAFGDYDVSFGGTGKVLIPGIISAAALVQQADGKLVVAGLRGDSGNPRTPFDDQEMFALVRCNPDGTLDATFGGGTGIVTTSIDARARASGLVEQADGKLVVAGSSADSTTMYSVFALARYNPDGTLDTSFGEGTGIVRTSIGINAQASAIVEQTDGKLVVAGSAGDNGASTMFALARYTADGILDTSFGGGGMVTTQIGTYSSDHARSLLQQTDGKLVAAGSSVLGAGIPGHESAGGAFALARYNTDGTLDPTFGAGTGKVATLIYEGGASAIVQQADGKLVVAGSAYGLDGQPTFTLLRYEADGTVDATFGGATGTVTIPVNKFAFANALRQQADGKLVAAGQSSLDGTDLLTLVRYNTDGTLDAMVPVGPGKVTASEGGATALVQQPDGKFVAAGYGYRKQQMVFALARYLSDGPPCTTPRCRLAGTLDSPACGRLELPANLRTRLDKALLLIDRAVAEGGTKARILLIRARGALKSARTATRAASRRACATISLACSAQIRRIAREIAAGLRSGAPGRSARIVQLALMAQRQHADLVPRRNEPVERDVSRPPERDHQLTKPIATDSPDQRMRRKHLDRRRDRPCRRGSRLGVVLREEGERALEVGQRVRRVDYPRHGLGRAGLWPCASRAIQA